MASAVPLLDLGAARCIAQKHAGAHMEAAACWQPPKDMYLPSSGDCFYFAVMDRISLRVGGTRHVAVDRRTGAIIELGMLGE